MATYGAAPLPDLAQINRASMWLAYFRKLSDQGKTITDARRIADERFGFGSGSLSDEN